MNSSQNQWGEKIPNFNNSHGPESPPAATADGTHITNTSVFNRLQNIASLSQVIRSFGACAIIASMSLFMLQGWAEGNDITRYLKLLAQTGLLTGAGLVLSFLVKEFKGARVFFGLALVSVVANFTILGSLIYSLIPLDMQVVDYPASMKWTVGQGVLFLPIFLGAISLLSAVAYFGFSIFSRQIAKPLSIAFLGLSASLLIPIRAPLIAVALAGATLWIAYKVIQGLRNTENLVMTRETKVSLAILLLPGFIILARAISFYSIDEVTLLALSSLLFGAVRNASNTLNLNKWPESLSQIILFALSAFISLMVCQVLPTSWNNMDILVGSTIFTGFTLDAIHNRKHQQHITLIGNLSAIIIVGVSILAALLESSLIYSAQAMLASGLALTISLGIRTSPSRIFAMVGLGLASLMVLFDIVELVQLGNWIIIGLGGALLIIGASLYERFGLKLSTTNEPI